MNCHSIAVAAGTTDDTVCCAEFDLKQSGTDSKGQICEARALDGTTIVYQGETVTIKCAAAAQYAVTSAVAVASIIFMA